MKRITIAFLAFLAVPVMADEPATPLAVPPATQPMAAAIAPATQPALTPAAMANVGVNTFGPARVLLLPFSPIDPADRKDWIGRGVQQNMLTDLSRAGGLQPITLDASKPENTPPAGGFDGDAAVRIARTQNADFVIYGTYQVADTDLRIIGVITDVISGQPIGGIKATGPIREVFAMEDSLSNQARRLLPQPVANEPAPVAPAVAAAPPAAPVVAPLPPAPLAGPVAGPLRAPHDTRFDDDPADISRDNLRYNDYPIGPGYFGSVGFLGYGVGYGWPYTPVWSGGFVPPSRPDPLLTPGLNRSPETAYIHPTPATGNYNHPIPQTGNYIKPTPQTGNFVKPTPQTGNFVKPTPQTGNFIRPVDNGVVNGSVPGSTPAPKK